MDAGSLPFTRADIEQTIPLRFHSVVNQFPDHIALTGNGRRWSYRDLNRHANRIAHAIRERLPSGTGCVAFLAGHSPEMVIASLAVLKAAKIYLAIHPSMPAGAQREIVRDAAPELLLTTRALESRAREMAAGVCTLSIDEIDVCYSDENPPPAAEPGDPLAIFYTSGTTGSPKGVVKSHRATLHRIWLSTKHDCIVPQDRISLLSHSSFVASEGDIFGALLQGAALCVFDLASEGLTAFGEWLGNEQITIIHPPVLLFRRFLATLEGTGLFPTVRLVTLGGDAVLTADLEKWRVHFSKPCALIHRFSTTETALLALDHIHAGTPIDSHALSVGRPVADKCLSLIDEAGHIVPQGETGELVVKSRYIADGYWRRPTETAAAFLKDSDEPGQKIYRTGDLARFLPDGRLVYIGRRDHQVKIRGYRVDTREVEAALLGLHEVAEAAIVARKEHDENQLHAFVVPKPGCSLDQASIRSHLRTSLPEWKIPASFQSISALPATVTGKIDRQLLEQTSATEPPPTIEQEIADIWKATLHVDAARVDDHFLELGGNSISAMMTLNRLEKRYGVRFTIIELFDNATIRQLAALVRGRTGAPIADPAPQHPRNSQSRT